MPRNMPDTDAAPESSLGKLVVRGAIHLTTRRIISLVLSFLGALLITRIIGPEIYGVYNAAYGVFSFLVPVVLMGMHVYLVKIETVSKELLDTIFWWLLCIGFLFAILFSILFYYAGIYWSKNQYFSMAIIVLSICIPVSAVSYVPISTLERQLNYKKVALIETVSQCSYYVIAIPLAWLGWGIWALLMGFIVNQISFFALSFLTTKYIPKTVTLHQLKTQLSPAITYSLSQAASGWVYNLRLLAPSVLLLPTLGAASAGYWALVNRLLNVFSFVKATIERLCIPLFARQQNDIRKFTDSVSTVLSIQILLVGTTLSIFSLFVHFALSYIVGDKWNIEIVMVIYCILSVRVLIASIISITYISFQIINKNLAIIKSSIIQTSLFFLLGYVSTIYTQDIRSLYLFSLVDLLSHMPAIIYLFFGETKNNMRRLDWVLILLWFAAATLAISAPLLSWWTYVIVIIVMLFPMSIKRLHKIYKLIKNNN